MKQKVTFLEERISSARTEIDRLREEKASLEKRGDFTDFYYRLLQCFSLISPRMICMEVGKPQSSLWQAGLGEIGYSNIIVKDSFYYGNKNNKCDIIVAVKAEDVVPEILQNMPFVDEEKVIDYICKNVSYSCIGDPCMGKGLVAYYSNKYGKKFVGTELNYKRLAVCCERVTKNERGRIN